MGRREPVRRLWQVAFIAGLALVLLGWRPALAAQDPWPKSFEHPQGTVVMYQPQLEEFKGDLLTARAAVSVKKKVWKNPVFGAIWLSGRVTTDRDTRMATIDEVKVTEAKFPEASPEQMEKLKTFLNDQMSGASVPISLDRLLAALEVVEREQAGDRGLKNEPPKIIFVAHPAMLVPLDGDPKLLPVPKSPLMRVANTPFLMLYDTAAKTYYLKGGETWLAANDLKGPWKEVKPLPEAIKTLMAEAEKAAPGQGAAAKQVEAAAGKMPEIVVSTVPAELLATDGEPQYTPIKDTNLLFVSNTEDQIFLDTAGQEYYVLISGRWFKSKSLSDGPWAYVAPNQLPPDFAKIPEGSVKGFVLVSVAGTPQAKEAVLENSIPQTAVIDRKKATTKVEYAGAPKFEKIADTDLESAVNTGTTVFKEGTKYYALDQGVWYEADTPNGPWRAAAQAPKDMDKIPPSNPNYNARYVKVYEATDDTVTVGYTPGYTGSYTDNGTVVYGTGYNYSGYSSPEAYIPPPAPVTYGYAAAYDPYAGSWGYQPSYYNPASWLVPSMVGLAAGVAIGYAAWGHGPYWGGGGWWGPHGYNNININNIHNNVINPRPRPPGPGPGPRPGPPGPHPPHWGPDGRPIVHPVTGPQNRANLYNRPNNQNRLAPQAGKPGVKPAAAVSPERPGQAGKPQPGAKPGQAAAKPKPAQPKVRPAGGQNNVLADKNGNVYKRDNAGNWQQRQGNQWSGAGAQKPAARPTTPSRPTPPSDITRRPPSGTTHPAAPTTRPSFDSSQLNRDFAARQRGETRTQNFQRAQSAPSYRPSPSMSRPSPSFSRPSGGGGGAGGFRGPGGGGRRR